MVSEQISDTVFGAPIRLGVTGLAHSCKSVLISEMVSNMLEGGGRMPQLSAVVQGLVVISFLQPQKDDTVARFDYEQNIDLLKAPSPAWSKNVRRMSQLRISLRIRSANIISSLLWARVQHINLIDYPGEWILDLGLLSKSYSQ